MFSSVCEKQNLFYYEQKKNKKTKIREKTQKIRFKKRFYNPFLFLLLKVFNSGGTIPRLIRRFFDSEFRLKLKKRK